MEPIEEKPTTGRKARLAIDLNVCASQMEEMNFENVGHVTPEHNQSELNRTQREATGLELDEREESLKATSVVKQYHGILKKAVGEAAPTPGQAGLERDGQLVMCQCCGNAESLGKTIICDGCESSFHVGCMKLRQAQAAKIDDWVCRTCNTQCIRPKWPVGRIAAANEVQKAETAHNGEGASVPEKERSSRNRAKLVAGTPPEGKLRKRKRKSEADLEDRPKRRLSVSNTTEIIDSKFVNQLQLPLECMDLRINSFGTVDLRPGYSDANHTWPVGFCSLWHDTLTGSICISQVLEGGPSGPVFRVTRRPCSSMPDMGKTNEVHGSGRGCNINQIDNSHIRKEGTGNLHKLDAEGKQKCINTRTDLADPNSTSNLETWSGQLHDEEDELHSLISSLQIFSPESAPAIECASFFSKELAEDLKSKDLESMGTDPSNDRTAIMVLGKYVGLGAKSTELVSGDICKNARSSTIGFTNLFEGSKETAIEHKQEQNASELVQWSRYSNSNLEEIFVEDKDSNPCPNDAIGEIIVEASSSAEAWTRLAKKFVVCYRESLTQSTNSPVRCFHLEVGSSPPSLCLKDLLGIDVKEPGNKDNYSETLCKALEDWIGQDRYGFDIPVVEKVIRANKAKIEAIRPPPPPGRPIGRNFPAELVGDLLQIWEFLCRFYELLGYKDPPSLDDLEEGLCDPLQDKFRNNYDLSLRKVVKGLTEKPGDERVYIPPETESNKFFGQSLQHSQHAKTSHDGMYCHNTVLAAIHISLLKILLGDLQPKVLGGLDVILDTKRGKKKDGEPTSRTKKQSCGLLPLNEMTWPEVARRYVIALTLMDLPGENIELNIQEHRKLLRCLLGDGGVLCGALDGVAGIETDAQLLAEAEKQVFGRRSSLGTEQSSDDKILEQQNEDDSTIPEWAVVLEPVRKLATNVGARIRNCVRDALSKDPPEWAKEILEWSISKEVYKGNASGPTKRAVLQVLAQVTIQEPKPKINIVKKKNYVIPIPTLVMKRCRLVLRQLITSDEWRVFCNLLSGTVLGYYESKDDRSELAPVMVPRPLDFRIIDSRLATGAYGESHESFLADMQQLWKNIPVIFHDREDMIKVGESLSQQFEALYQDRVINLINRKEEPSELGNSESFIGLDEKFMKAPWEEGVCKICGIDKDDDLVLLCDGCDAEYHIYCLNPPLSKIPEGNWYCPSCIAHDKGLFNSTEEINKSAIGVPHTKSNTEKDWLISVCTSLGEREYWQLNVKEKILLLKFLCDKALDSGVIRDHLEQCGDTSLELQQKLRSLLLERQSHAIRSNSLAEENSEVTSRETGRPKRRSGRNLRASDVSLHIDGIEMPARVLEEMEKLHSDHMCEGGGMEMLQTKTNMQARQLLDGQPNKQQNTFFPPNVHDINRTTDNVLNDLNIPLEVLTEEQGHQMTKPGSESKEKSHASSRVLVEVPANSPADVPQEESCKHYKQLDGKLEELLKIDHQFEVGTIRQSDYASLCNENGSDLLVPDFIVQQLHEVPKSDERNNVKVNGTSESNMKVASSISRETQAAVQQDNKGMENTGELDHSLCLKYGIKSGSDQTLLPQVNMGEQPALPGANVELNWPAQAASLLETEIENIEMEIGKTALRRECLGRDLLDRMYWSLVWGGTVPYLAVEVGNSCIPGKQLEKESKEIASHTKIDDAFSNNCSIAGLKHQPLIETGDLRLDVRESNLENWIMYETDSDFEQLLQWLNPKNQKEKNLISAIMQWRMLFSYRIHRECLSRGIVHKQQTKMKAPGAFPGTKATLPYVRKHGPIRWPEKSNDFHVRKRGRIKRVQPEDGMFRCDCLELVWPTRCHCELCHETFESSVELQNHNNGVCFSKLSALRKQSANMPAIVKPKKRKGDMHMRLNEEYWMHINRNHKLNGKRHLSTSFDFSLVVKRFHIQSSTRERILQIGCIADGGPIFLPAPPFVLDGDFSPPTTGTTDAACLLGITNIHSQSPLHNQTITVGTHLTGCQPSNKKPTGDMVRTTSLEGTVDTSADQNLQSSESEDIHQNAGKFNPNSAKQDTEIRPFIPVASMQPLPATNSIFFKRLKASLLDIEAVLAPEAFECSRGDAAWRRSWRFFLKSATSIYGLIQALITLEQMLKADCLKESWCHWASLSSAVKTTTLSSLALRVFSLDAAIKYKNIRVAFDLKNDEKSCKR